MDVLRHMLRHMKVEECHYGDVPTQLTGTLHSRALMSCVTKQAVCVLLTAPPTLDEADPELTAVEHEPVVITCPLENIDAETQIIWSRVRSPHRSGKIRSISRV